jgi:hypothetical protein
MIYLIHCKNVYKCHYVLQPSTIIKRKKKIRKTEKPVVWPEKEHFKVVKKAGLVVKERSKTKKKPCNLQGTIGKMP